ncbi:chitin deacetylase [Alsobacter metallidurans]|uniref:Chitooligosaccharide deacetylase n=1 Tax=Alsobacter metallidurans TaxID=340221 RepID=A0A917I777_9HYPH|nr:polysaccharide deacetylase family protein [Alsobacter metallidurans]GGH17852.1 chitin deacetylase [Alsobacter metallidurans]
MSGPGNSPAGERGLAHDRDFAGYRAGGPSVRWPGDARLAVSVVVNIEEGAELSLGMGDERNEFIYEAVEKVEGARDLCMESHFEYGVRAGWPRIRALLKRYGVAATLNANGRALEISPWIAREAVADGHEVSSHGYRWERQVHMDEAAERRVILRAAKAIEAAAGAPPVGWHTRSATSVNTRRLLIEHGGFLYDSNAYNDDVPFLVEQDGRRHVVLPYAFDTNDMRFYNGGGFVFADDFARYCIDAFERLYAEGADAPRMLSIGLHLRIIGRPARIGGLERLLEHMAARPGVWFARRDAIAKAWLAGLGEPPWAPRPTPAGFAAGEQP